MRCRDRRRSWLLKWLWASICARPHYAHRSISKQLALMRPPDRLLVVPKRQCYQWPIWRYLFTDRSARLAKTTPIIIEQHGIDPALLILGSEGPGCGHRLFVEFWMSFEMRLGRPHDLSMW